ncbi:MAG: pilus assembly protein [Planctomycetota bacterium]
MALPPAAISPAPEAPGAAPAAGRTRRGRSTRNNVRGAVLVEFAFIALLMYLLIAVVIDFGRLFFSAHAVQDAARATARELATIPLPAGMTLEQALQDPVVRQRVYEPAHLVIDLDNIPGGLTLEQFSDSLPVLNKMLRPLMIFEQRNGRRLLRYPGALLEDASTPSGLTVGIPLVEGRDGDGRETIRWVPVIEEIQNANFPGASPFSMNTPAGMPERGLVAIRINYPWQAAMMTGYLQAPGGPTAPNVSRPILADDNGVAESNAAPGSTLADDGAAGAYAGAYGLGRLYAQGQTVRPFRKLLTAQMVMTREVFD